MLSLWIQTGVLYLCFALGLVRSNEDMTKIRIAGENAFSKGDLKEATKYYSQLIDLDVSNERNYYKRFRVYLSDRKYSKALSDLTSALTINPSYKKALSQRGKVHLMLGHCSLSKADYQSLTILSKGDDIASQGLTKATECEILLNLAEEAQSKGQYQQAYDHVSRLIDDFASSSGELLMERAALSISLGNVFDAIADSGHALKLDGNNLQWLQFRGELFYELGDLMSINGALQHFKQALHSDPEHKAIKVLYRKVKQLKRLLTSIATQMEEQALAQAVESITSALAIDPANRELMKDLYAKLCESQMQNMQHKKQACTTAIEYDREYAWNHARLGYALLQLEDFETAVREYTTAHELDGADKAIGDGLRQAQAALKQSKTKNFYKILGVKRNANDKEIKKAYRKKALEWHPDKHNGDKDLQERASIMFQDIAEAYEILSSEDLRKRYDRGEDVTGNPESQQRQRQHPFFQRGGGTNFHFNFN